MKNWEPYEKTMEDYIKKTVITKNPIEIFDLLKSYLKENFCIEEVKNFIENILNNIDLINKIQIVLDGSGRNICYLIRPDDIMQIGQHYEKGKTILDYAKKAEIIFINLTEETKEEADRIFAEEYEDQF